MYAYPSWLHEDMVKGVKGFNLDAYLIALEGWQRGLSLQWYLHPENITTMNIDLSESVGNIFKLTSDENTHYFVRSIGDKVDDRVYEFVKDANLVTKHLEHAQLLTINTKSFSSKFVDEKLLDYVETREYPQVKQSKYRFYMIKDQVVGIVKCVPAHVTGDGQSTIEQLIQDKNNERKENPYLRTKLLKKNTHVINELSKYRMNLQSIPKIGQTIFLRDDFSMVHGGEAIEVMDYIPTEVVSFISEALQSIAGIVHAGIDVIVQDNQLIIERIDPRADIAMHVFPTKGEPVNIPKYIIDEYFPHTINSKVNREMYFNYQRVRKLLYNGIVSQCTIENCDNAPIIKKRFIVKGKVQKVSYRKWIQKQALKIGLNGYTRNLKNGNVIVVVGGKQNIVDTFKAVCEQGSPRSNVTEVITKDWNKPIGIGFNIKKTI